MASARTVLRRTSLPGQGSSYQVAHLRGLRNCGNETAARCASASLVSARIRSSPMAQIKTARASSVVNLRRKAQKDTEAKTRKRDTSKARRSGAVQAGPHAEPENPLPAQHQQKPGIESQLDPRPLFIAPDYIGSAKLKNKVALITGSDSGIGRAVAVLFAREGADIAIVYLSEDGDAHETAQRVEAEGGRCVLLRGDVRDPKFCSRAVVQTVETLGKLDILVNNAAFQEHAGSIMDISEDQFDLTMKTNIYGYFHMAKAAVPYLGRGGCIINTGSETGLFGSKELLDYSTTKGAIHTFTQSLATNLLERGIRVNAVAPGPVWTPLNPSDRSAEEVKSFGAHSGMKRPAQPEEISPAYVFLASPQCSSYITGEILPIIGGY